MAITSPNQIFAPPIPLNQAEVVLPSPPVYVGQHCGIGQSQAADKHLVLDIDHDLENGVKEHESRL